MSVSTLQMDWRALTFGILSQFMAREGWAFEIDGGLPLFW